MNSAGKGMTDNRSGGFAAAFLLVLGLSLPAAAQTAPAYSAVPTPSPQAASELAGETPSDFIGEGDGSGANMNLEEVLSLLRNSNGNKPLSIAQLAQINDAMKRMDYMAQLQRRMNEAQMAGSTGGLAGRNMPPLDGEAGSMSGGLTVLHISGTGGRYRALVTNGQQQMFVKEGDTVGTSRIGSIDMSGVRVVTETGSTLLPFASPVSVISGR